MKTITTTNLKNNISNALDDVNTNPLEKIIVTRGSKSAGVLLGIDTYSRMEKELELYRKGAPSWLTPELDDDIRAGMREAREGKTTPFPEDL